MKREDILAIYEADPEGVIKLLNSLMAVISELERAARSARQPSISFDNHQVQGKYQNDESSAENLKQEAISWCSNYKRAKEIMEELTFVNLLILKEKKYALPRLQVAGEATYRACLTG